MCVICRNIIACLQQKLRLLHGLGDSCTKLTVWGLTVVSRLTSQSVILGNVHSPDLILGWFFLLNMVPSIL